MMKIIYVYECFTSSDSVLMGKLYVDLIRGKESYSFEYDSVWLKNNNNCFFLDPDLNAYNGRQYVIDKTIFGVFADSAPDRWGRILIKRREIQQARKENRKPRLLLESDFLLGVFDETRLGAIRFKLEENGEFVSNDGGMATPPWTSLRKLQDIAIDVDSNKEVDEEWLALLIRPGSSLGGARPKANVVSDDGSLWIAKFPSKNDDYNVGAWEKVASDLAKLCGLNVPETKVEKLSIYGDTFLSKRFDRIGKNRIHFASAMTMLGKKDGESSDEGVSYLDIVEFIRSNGVKPNEDMRELWKRIVFNMAISNTDDHLRNHGFILEKRGWRLSPLYDVNPNPFGNELSLLVDNVDSSISLDLAIKSCEYYALEESEAIKLANEILNVVQNNWRKLALKYGINRDEIERMSFAFNKLK